MAIMSFVRRNPGREKNFDKIGKSKESSDLTFAPAFNSV